MITPFKGPSPEGRNTSTMPTECMLPRRVKTADRVKSVPFASDTRAIQLNGKTAAIADRELAVNIFESGAMPIGTDNPFVQFLAPVDRWRVLQTSGDGPLSGQTYLFAALRKNPSAAGLNSRAVQASPSGIE